MVQQWEAIEIDIDGAPPPSFGVRTGNDIRRRTLTVFCGMPLFGQFREQSQNAVNGS